MRSLQLVLAIIFIITSCSKNQFTAAKQSDSFAVEKSVTYSNYLCSKYTLVKPQVDFVFLWDNSSSTRWVDPSKMSALKNTIRLVSDQFDYRIAVVPLVHETNKLADFSKSFIITSSPTGFTTTAVNMIADLDTLSTKLDAFPKGATLALENGVDRMIEAFKYFKGQNVIRSGANHIAVIISDSDDKVLKGTSVEAEQINIANRMSSIVNLRDSILNSGMFRVISLIPQPQNDAANATCKTVLFGSDSNAPSILTSRVYLQVSKRTYESNSSLTDQLTKSNTCTQYSGQKVVGYNNNQPILTPCYDSYDLCTNDFNSLFETLNSSIQQTVLNHKYNYWPVVDSGVSIDPSQIIVTKITSSGTKTNVLEKTNSSTDGWEYVGEVSNQDLRYDPSSGEPYTGKVVKLYGNSIVTYPECMSVTTKAPAEFYGYFVIPAKAFEDTLVVKVNGVSVPKYSTSTGKGWEYLGFNSSYNIRIRSKTDYTATSPAILKTGHVYKLYGSEYTLSNNDQITIDYNPQSN